MANSNTPIVLQVVGGAMFAIGLLAVYIFENAMLNGETIRLEGAIRMAPR